MKTNVVRFVVHTKQLMAILTVSALAFSAPAATWYWDGNTQTSNTLSDNTNNTTGQDWLSGGYWDNGTSQTLSSWTAGDSAIFGGTSSTQTVTAASFTIGNLTFGSGTDGSGTSGTAYTISGGTLTLSSTTITANTATTISSKLTGTSSLTKAGSAMLTLSGSSDYSGGTTINSGTLSFANGSLGSSGVITMNGGTLQWVSGNTQDVSARFTMVNTKTATLDTNGNDVTLGTAFGGTTSGSLTKIGTGTLTLSGANNFTGNVVISGGTVLVSYTTGGTTSSLGNMTTATKVVTVNSGATLKITAADVFGGYNVKPAASIVLDGGTLWRVGKESSSSYFNSLGDITLKNGATIQTGTGNVATVQALAFNGTVTVSGTSGSSIVATSGTSLNGIHLGTVGGSTTFDVGTTGSTYDLSVGVVLADKVLGGAANLIKTGAGTMLSTARNTYTGTTTVSQGTLRLNDARSMNGATTVSSGATLTIESNNNGGYFQPASLTVNGGTVASVVVASNRYHGIYTTSINTTGTSIINTPLYISKTGTTNNEVLTIDVATGGTTTLNGSILNHPDNSGGLVTKTGAGTLILSNGSQNGNSTTLTGNVTINGGTVRVNYTANSTSPTATALGNMTTSGRTITVNSGATLRFDAADPMGAYNYLTPVAIIADGGTISRIKTDSSNYFNSLGNITLKNGAHLTTADGGSAQVNSFGLNGTLTVSGTTGSYIDTTGSSNNGIHLGYSNGTITFDVGDTTSAVDLAVSAPLLNPTLFSDNGTTAALLKAGAGTMLLSASNAYTGGTTIRAGTIIASNASALGSSGTVTLTDASTSSSDTSLMIDATAGGITIGRAITVANNGSGTVTLGSVTSSGSNQAIFSGAVTLNKNATLNGGTAGDRLGFSGDISGTGSVTVSGTNRVLFSGTAKSYSGTTTVNSGAILQLSDGTATSNSFLYDTSSVTVNGTLKLAKGGNTEAIGGLTGGGTVEAIAGSDTLSVGGGDATADFTGVLRNNGATLSLTKTGAGTQTLSGINTYTGTTTINQGTLALGHATNTLADNGAINVNGGTLDIAGNNDTVGVVKLTSGSITGTTGMLTGSSYAVESGTVSAKLGGSGIALTKSTTGMVTLSGVNTYTGTTTVSEGTLAVNGSLTSSINVSNGARLQGTGVTTGGLILSGTVAPGNSIGSLGVEAVLFDSTATLDYELNTTTATFSGDLLHASGALYIVDGAVLTLTDEAPGSLSMGSKLTLISYNGTWDNGLFFYDTGTLGDDTTFTLGSNTWLFNYNDTSGGTNFTGDQSGAGAFVTMTVIPEPGTVGVVASFLAAALWRRRRFKE